MMRARRFGLRLGLVLVAICLGLAAAPVASAQEEIRDQCFFPARDVTVPAGQEIPCRSLRVIGGDVSIGDGAVLRGNLEVAGGKVTLAGAVEGDAFVFGDLALPPGGSVAGNAFVTGDLSIREGSQVGGDATVLGNADVAGMVDGDMMVAGDVVLRSTAVVSKVAATGSVQREPGAEVRDTEGSGQGGGPAVMVVLLVLFTLLSALFAALLVALGGTAAERVRRAAAESPLLSLLVGAVAWGGALPLAIVLLPTVLGPFLVLLGLMAGILLGWVALSLGLGQRLWPNGGPTRAAAVGAAVLSLVALLALGAGTLSAGLGGPSGALVCLGMVFLILLWTWGLGASLLTAFGLRRWPQGSGSEPETSPVVPLPGMATVAAPVVEASGHPPATFETAPDEAAGPESAVMVAAGADDGLPPVEGSPGTVVVPAPDGVEDAPVPASSADTLPSEAPLAAASGVPSADDWTDGTWTAVATRDVREVPGVSPIYGLLLAQAGYGTVGELAVASAQQVVAAVTAPGVLPVDEAMAGAWIRAARDMAAKP